MKFQVGGGKGLPNGSVTHENVSGADKEYCVNSFIPTPDRGCPGAVLGAGDVGMRKVPGLWEGQKLLKSWDA